MDTLGSTAVIVHSRPVGVQEVRLAGPGVSFKVTVLNPSDLARHEESLQRFLDHTTLLALQWINVHRSRVTFKTLRNGGTAGADRKIGD